MGQELSTAKYYQESLQAAERASSSKRIEQAASPPRRAPAAVPSALERWVHYATPAVAICLALGAGAAFWLNRAELAEDASYVDKRLTNPFNLVMWMGGSDKTFDQSMGERFQEVIDEIEKETAKDWTGGSALETSFERVDSSKLNVGFGKPSVQAKPSIKKRSAR